MGDSQQTRLTCRFYMTPAGRQPVREWLQGLPRGAKRTIGADIQTVQFDWPLGKPLVDGFGSAFTKCGRLTTETITASFLQ